MEHRNPPDSGTPSLVESYPQPPGRTTLDAIAAIPKSVPTMDDTRRGIAAWLDIYHRTPHRGIDGHTPLGVWQTASHLRRALDDGSDDDDDGLEGML